MMDIVTLESQIKTANALGRNNLNAKGITTDGNETTYQLMNMISNIQSGGGETVTTSPIICKGKVEVIIPLDIYGNVTINSNNISVNSTVEIVEE